MRLSVCSGMLSNTKVHMSCLFSFKHLLLTIFLYQAEDEATATCIQSKNSLELYSYNLHNSITNENLTDKFKARDKAKLENADLRGGTFDEPPHPPSCAHSMRACQAYSLLHYSDL